MIIEINLIHLLNNVIHQLCQCHHPYISKLNSIQCSQTDFVEPRKEKE